MARRRSAPAADLGCQPFSLTEPAFSATLTSPAPLRRLDGRSTSQEVDTAGGRQTVPRAPLTYCLSPKLLSAHAGASVLCLSPGALGQTFRLHATRPGPALNRRPYRAAGGGVEWRADLPSGAHHAVKPVEASLVRVDISGPLEQRAGYHDPCAGWTDGHDAIADRLCAAFAEGDVLLVIDSPGGAAAGTQQHVERAQRAKAKHGRRVTVFGDEMIASGGAWWGLALGDELFLPTQGRIGSIGARGGHLDVSEAMAKDGLKMTYFADPPDKIAFAMEMPLSAEASRRGNRDVRIIADAFRAGVCAGPVGLRYGLTPERLIELGADMLTGQAAVDFGLADGVESLEAVTAHALTMTSASAKDINTSAHALTRNA